MFWLLSFPQIQFLILLWVLQLIYTAYATATSNINFYIKPVVIISLFVLCYFTIDISKNWVGTPSFTDDEIVGTLSGFDQFTYEGKEQLVIMVSTKTGPFMFSIPYDADTEKSLNKSMAQKITTGKPTIIRKLAVGQLIDSSAKDTDNQSENSHDRHGHGDGSGGNGPMEFYDFTDQYLVPKSK